METNTSLKLSFVFAVAALWVNLAKSQVPQYVNQDGLISWYGFSNGSTEDGTSNNQDLQNLGCTPTADRFGGDNNAFNFDGIATYMRRNNFQFPWSESCSISIWFKRSGFQNTATMVNLGDSFAQDGTWRVRTDGVSVVRAQSYLYNGASITLTGSADGINEWFHLVFVRSEENGTSLFVNGDLEGESDLSELMEGFVDLYIGASAGPGAYFDGQLDDIGIWEKGLTVCEVKKLFLAYEHSQPQGTTAVVGSNATFSISNNSGVNYQWQVNSGTGWQDLSNFGQYTGVNSNTLTVLNVGLSNNNFAFRCIVDYGDGCAEDTEIAILGVTPNTGLYDSPGIIPIGIFPNPNSGQFQLELENTEFTQKANITVIDHNGKTVYSSQLNGLRPTIELRDLPNGVYLVRISDDELTGTARISIVR